MAVQEGLGVLCGIGLHKATVAVGQVHDEAVGLLLHSADNHQGLAEVALGVPRRMRQGHEHLPGPEAAFSYVVLDRGISAVKPVLVPEPLEDAPGRVTLLLGDPVVFFQDVVDDAGEGLLLSLAKDQGGGEKPAAGSPAARSRPASCAQSPGAIRTSAPPPGCSSPLPSPPCGPEDISPPELDAPIDVKPRGELSRPSSAGRRRLRGQRSV